MVELSKERVEQMLHDEAVEKEELSTILRGVYLRYMRLYEQYFADIDALNNEKIEELKKYHEETGSLIKYYYMDIPHDICDGIKEFEEKFTGILLGSEWRKHLADGFKEFTLMSKDRGKGEAYLKKAFTKEIMENFYEAIGYVLREGFDTGSKTAQNVISGLSGLLFGKED